MASRTHYEVLEISSKASSKEIRVAYVRLARELHPDKHPHDTRKTEEFKRVQAAYETLSDSHRRLCYDVFGADISDSTNPDGQLLKVMAGCCCCCLTATSLFSILLLLKIFDAVDTPWALMFLPLWLLDALLIPVLISTWQKGEYGVSVEVFVVIAMTVTVYGALAGFVSSWLAALLPIIVLDVAKGSGCVRTSHPGVDDGLHSGVIAKVCRPLFLVLAGVKLDGGLGLSWWVICLPMWLRIVHVASDGFTDTTMLMVCTALYIVPAVFPIWAVLLVVVVGVCCSIQGGDPHEAGYSNAAHDEENVPLQSNPPGASESPYTEPAKPKVNVTTDLDVID